MPKYDIITFGDMCVDLIINGSDVVPEFGQVEKLVGDYILEMGGSSCIFACQSARLGLRVGILGRVGRDSFGELVLARLRECGVDTDLVIVDPTLKTGLGIALCTEEGDRAILTYLGSINAIAPEDVTDDILASARHLHHGSYFLHTRLRPHIPHIFSRARRLGLTISLDTNWDPDDAWGAEVQALLPQTDIFMPNEAEALRIAGAPGLEEALARLRVLGANVVTIKRGSRGALVSDRQQVIRQQVEPVTGGDSIGAGDSFDAGFLAGWLRGRSLEESLRIGCACGRSVAAQIGGLAGQPSWNHISHSSRSIS